MRTNSVNQLETQRNPTRHPFGLYDEGFSLGCRTTLRFCSRAGIVGG